MNDIIINVAEKPSVARQLNNFLLTFPHKKKSEVNSNSKYNPIYLIEDSEVFPRIKTSLYVTSVIGHLKTFDFHPNYSNWYKHKYEELLNAPLVKNYAENCLGIVKNLEKIAKKSNKLILWLDCDREGESIAGEVRDICVSCNRNLIVLRAKFSSTDSSELENAIYSLQQINERLILEVNVRQELDFRMGSIMTRLLTTKLLKKLTMDLKCLSYGPCQFPTLALVVEDWLKNQIDELDFVYTYEMKIIINDESNRNQTELEFHYENEKIACYDKLLSFIIYEEMLSHRFAEIKKNSEFETIELKPLPMHTIMLINIACKKFKMNSAKTLKIAENLYCYGFISYPRTETQIFSDSFDHVILLKKFLSNNTYGSYVDDMLNKNQFEIPRKGKSDDNAHPPIHPLKNSDYFASEDEKKIFNLILEHYLTCCSKNCKGSKHLVIAEIGPYKFSQSFKTIVDPGFRKLENSTIKPTNQPNLQLLFPLLEVGKKFPICNLVMHEKRNPVRPILSESDLIMLMDKHGIGTDATIAEHIKTIELRHYITKDANLCIVPTKLGLILCLTYKKYCFDLIHPDLRKNMERDVKQISISDCDKQYILDKYKVIFKQACKKIDQSIDSIASFFSLLYREDFDKIVSNYLM